MFAQVAFTANQDLKNRALQKAKMEGITLKALFIYAMKAFVDGKISLTIDVIDKNEEKDVEELTFTDASINAKAAKLAHLLS